MKKSLPDLTLSQHTLHDVAKVDKYSNLSNHTPQIAFHPL
jgi:hypothetical protein